MEGKLRMMSPGRVFSFWRNSHQNGGVCLQDDTPSSHVPTYHTRMNLGVKAVFGLKGSECAAHPVDWPASSLNDRTGLLWADFLSAEVAYKFTIVLDCMSRLATPASPGLDVANCWPAVYKRKDGKQCNRATEQYTQWNLIGILKSESIVFSYFWCLLL